MRHQLLVWLLLGCLFWPVMPIAAQAEIPPTGRGAPPTLSGARARSLVQQSLLSAVVNSHAVHLLAPVAVKPLDVATWVERDRQPAEDVACIAQQYGLNLELVGRANHYVYPTAMAFEPTLNLPAEYVPAHVVTARASDTPLAVAMRHQVPLWQVLRRAPLPLYAGQYVALPLPATAPCLPYPLKSVTLSPQPMLTGRTAILTLETIAPAACEVTYLGHTEPCYTADGTHLYALLGISALTEPGDYEIRIRLQADDLTTAFDLPLTLESGRYGFQFIRPPAQLNRLMDEALMAGELEYLATWRAIRTSERQWSFPLTFPLSRKVSISADYGARRSYGGLVDGYHSGVDYRAWTGLPVLAPANGVVLMAEHLEARGNAILIDHGWGLVTGYWHLSRIDVEVGQHVARGEQIAMVGNTGLSTGSHLHWEVWINGVSVDGKQWLDEHDAMGLTLPALNVPEPAILLDDVIAQ